MIASGIHSARDDGRFTPLQPDELEDLDLEFSVLTKPTSVIPMKTLCTARKA